LLELHLAQDWTFLFYTVKVFRFNLSRNDKMSERSLPAKVDAAHEAPFAGTGLSLPASRRVVWHRAPDGFTKIPSYQRYEVSKPPQGDAGPREGATCCTLDDFFLFDIKEERSHRDGWKNKTD